MTSTKPTGQRIVRKGAFDRRPLWTLYVVSIGGFPLRKPRRYELRSPECQLGRSKCEVKIGDEEDGSVSRSHALFTRGPRNSLWVKDLGSARGTFLDGIKVRSRKTEISDGSVLAFGDTIAIARLESFEPPPEVVSEPTVVAESRSFREVLNLLGDIAKSDPVVLLTGPSGSGKEHAARHLHLMSGRRGKFVPVNCAKIPEGVFESSVFGHARGSFSGAIASHRGYVGEAEGGTLFLDEIGEVSPGVQAKLLRFLEDRCEHSVGSSKLQKFDVQVVCGTNRDLEVEIAAGRFRLDVLRRFTHHLNLLPLVQRREEQLALLCRFWKGPSRQLSTEFAVALLLTDWVGNARDMRDIAEALSRAKEPHGAEDLPARFRKALRLDRVADLSRATDRAAEVDTARVRELLDSGESQRDVADQLGYSRRTMMRRLGDPSEDHDRDKA